MNVILDKNQIADLSNSAKIAGKKVCFVPTMGALHEGHLSLVQTAKELGDFVIMSIFVNPTQFGPNEDFSKYPRTLSHDLDLLAPLNIDAVFTPNTGSMYGVNHQTHVYNQKLQNELCGAYRPGHFEGVCTIVLKFLSLIQPNFLILGKKDFQQFVILRQMAIDLDIQTKVVGAETLRDPDGLAMSSRNRYLSEDERKQALFLPQALQTIKKMMLGGEKKVQTLLAKGLEALNQGKFQQIDYLEIRSNESLDRIESTINGPCIVLGAVRLASVRLIDNVELP